MFKSLKEEELTVSRVTRFSLSNQNLVSVHNLLAQIITFSPLLTGGKEKKLGIIIGYKNTSEPPADFMRTLLHRSAELSRMSSLKAYRPYL